MVAIINLKKWSMKSIYYLFFIVTLFSSCEQLEDLNNQNADSQMENGIYEFCYQGINYSTEYQKNGDEIVYKNEQVASLINDLAQNERIATFIHSDGTVEYFESLEELKLTLFPAGLTPKTKAFEFKATSSAVLTVFEDSKCKGKSIKYTIDANTYSVEVRTLDSFGDKISSIDLTCNWYVVEPSPYPSPYTHGNKCVATFFQDLDFKGYSVAFSVDPNYPNSQVHYFKSIPLYPGSSKNWNDRVSSLKFAFYDN